ncbi:MAG: protein phosphatase 2C domain-containing protein [Candidatus Poribacteria bacterium]|nr:protein phosphatase 2C domain-containing protein [Candidatus Poribacteria bacterium]
MIQLVAKSFITQKAAENREDCQDAFCQNEGMARYAVADGATQSFFPKEWAELLVGHFCEASVSFPTRKSWRSWIEPVQVRWYAQVKRTVEEHDKFYLNNRFKFKQPAASTFIGLEFDKAQAKWEAMIVGDSCLFHLDARGFRSYEIERSADFTNRPRVFASYDKDNHSEPSFVKCNATPGDTLILATDALAQWILQQEEAGKRDEVLSELKKIEDQHQFREFINRVRTDEDFPLVNDDVTLMIISVEKDKTQACDKIPEECSPVNTTRPPPELPPVLLWMMVAVFFGLPLLCYICYKCWLRFFFDRD